MGVSTKVGATLFTRTPCGASSTGAAAGIGAATIARFEAEGAVVVGLDADPGYDGNVGDVANPDDVARAVAAAGGLDILVANAGISVMEPFLGGDPTSWQRVLRVNLLGVLVCFQPPRARWWNTDAAGVCSQPPRSPGSRRERPAERHTRPPRLG
jgi:NAD(P)-dependent dehydrogenase (short-subunit alcohol dehydrogenase family)